MSKRGGNKRKTKTVFLAAPVPKKTNHQMISEAQTQTYNNGATVFWSKWFWNFVWGFVCINNLWTYKSQTLHTHSIFLSADESQMYMVPTSKNHVPNERTRLSLSSNYINSFPSKNKLPRQTILPPSTTIHVCLQNSLSHICTTYWKIAKSRNQMCYTWYYVWETYKTTSEN